MTWTLAGEEAIEARIAELPGLWRHPTRRYARTRSGTTTAMDQVWICRTASGETHRLRAASGYAARLLLNEHDALQKAAHPSLAAHRLTGRYRGSVFVATSWIEDDEDDEAGPIPLLTLLARMAEAARAVGALHGAGLVHGDLKPDTIRLGSGRVLVTDLQLAAPPGERTDGTLTPKYAAPEQVLGEKVGPPADVYALGVTLYELFIRERFPALLRGGRTRVGRPRPIPQLSADTAFTIPTQPDSGPAKDEVIGAKVLYRSQLERVVQGAKHAALTGDVLEAIRLATDLRPERRFAEAGALAEALEAVLKKGRAAAG